MARIGILTYHSGYNYGACLQAYALQSTLKKLGYDSEVINFETDEFVASREMFSHHPTRKKEFVKIITRLPYWNSLHKRQAMFDNFTSNVLIATPRFKTEDEVVAHADDYDCIICGSDQIWNLSKDHDAPAANPLFFLNFPKKQRRVAYAASFAKWVKEAPMHEDEFMPWIKLFDSISVREQDGVDYLRSRDIKCELTLDPTILLDSSDYEQIACEKLIEKKYIAMFGWNTNSDLILAAKHVSQQLGLPVYNIVPPPRGMFCGIPRKLDVGPCEFLSIIKNAEFVVTNSFHGTAFSTTFEKPYVSIITGEPDTRMFSLLNQLGLSDHLVTKDQVNLDAIYKTDFGKVNEKKVLLRQSSFEYLKHSLAGL